MSVSEPDLRFQPEVLVTTSTSGPATHPSYSKAQTLYRDRFKRVLDVMLVLLSIPLLIPLVLLLIIPISLDGGRPFYSQERLGMGGRPFRLWKLRSMVPDADARLAQHLEVDGAARAEWEETQKLRFDPRVTWIGRFIRRSSLDELPQFWNVLKGDMSLVGPRPMMTSQAPLYPGMAYFDMRPGITGLWQVSRRNLSSFAGRAWYDAQYLNTISFTQDVRILLATVRVVLRGTGC